MKGTVVVCLLVRLFVQGHGVVFYQPEQIHMSYGVDPSQMTFTWVTFDNASVAIIQYGKNSFEDTSAKGIIEKFVDGGAAKRVLYMNRVNATGLDPGEKYKYRVGSPLGWSAVFTFTAMKNGSDWGPSFALFGDMGNVNAQSLTRLQTETEEGRYDFIIHAGDFAYNMDNDNATRGDEFMRQIEPLAATVPYMTCVGNHEYAYNFSNYKYRFTMPKAGGEGRGLWYSFDVGPIHFIAWDTEILYYTGYGKQQVYNQYKWLEKDLQEANKNRSAKPWIITIAHRPMYCSNSDDLEHCQNPDNMEAQKHRQERPWIITFAHRPMYCSNKNVDVQHCQTPDNIVRIGDPTEKPAWGSPEDLFYKYGVDLQIAAHEHSYERMWPLYNFRVCNGSKKAPYTNPTAPVHIVTGSAGCQEDHDPFFNIPWPWSALKSEDYGYNRVKVYNKTHLYFEYVSDDKDGKVIDSIWYIKEKHGQGLYTCHLDMDAEYEKTKRQKFNAILEEFNRKLKAKQQRDRYSRRMRMHVNRPNNPERL